MGMGYLIIIRQIKMYQRNARGDTASKMLQF